MKSYRRLAYKELLAQKMTSFLIFIALILSTMMTAAIGQSAGVLSAMRQQQAIAIGGDRYATFVQLTEEQTAFLQNEPRLSYVGLSIDLGTVKLNSSLTLSLVEYQEGSGDAYPSVTTIKEGRLPQQPMEIALPKDAVQLLGFTGKIGDTVTLTLEKALRHGVMTESFSYRQDFILTGITESNYISYTSGILQGIVGCGTAEKVLPEEYLYFIADIRTADKNSFQETVHDIAAALELHELDTMYNTVYLDALHIPYDREAADTNFSDEGFSFTLFAGVLIGALFLIAAGLVIYNILKIAVTKRLEQYGTLRAIGARKHQLYVIVTLEVLLLCGAGIPVGLFFGVLSAKGILTAATSLLSPDLFLVSDSSELTRLIAENSGADPFYLAASALITLLFAFLAAFPAASFAAKASPVTAMSGVPLRMKRKRRRAGKIRNFERYYAALNLKRNPARTAVTVLSLTMSIAVFIALQSSVGMLNAAGSKETEHLGDYSLINETVGFSPEELEKLEADRNILSVAAMQFSLYEQDNAGQVTGISLDFTLQPGETFQLLGLNDSYLDAFFGSMLTPEELEAFRQGEGCIVRNPIPLNIEGQEIPRSSIAAGSDITVAGQKLPVLFTLNNYDGYLSVGNNGFINGVQVIVSDRLSPVLTGSRAYAEFLPALTDDADRDAVDTLLNDLCANYPGTTFLSYEETDRQLEESFAQIKLLSWGLILFVGLIGILNIINTVSTNIHTRLQEIGIQRAIGMSARSLCRTFLWESAIYGLTAALAGSFCGYLCTIFIDAATTDLLQLTAFPLAAALEASLLSVAACLLSAAIPLRGIRNYSIVDSMEHTE